MIAVTAIVVVVFSTTALGQIAALAIGVAAGLVFCSGPQPSDLQASLPRVSRRVGSVALVLFAALLLLASLPGVADRVFMSSFYRAGALVFGGGHVVLPLLQASVVQTGAVSEPAFLAGYGAAQALPGPLFSFAAYLGALSGRGPGGVAGAVGALAAIFLPGLLLLVGLLPFWDGLRRRPRVQAATRGANAAVVGVLAAALYSPVWTSAVHSSGDFALAAGGFVALTVLRLPSVVVVAATTVIALMLA